MIDSRKVNVSKIILCVSIIAIMFFTPIIGTRNVAMASSENNELAENQIAIGSKNGVHSNTIVIPESGTELSIRIMAEDWWWPAQDTVKFKITCDEKIETGFNIGFFWVKNNKITYDYYRKCSFTEKEFELKCERKWHEHDCDHVVIKGLTFTETNRPSCNYVYQEDIKLYFVDPNA